MLKKALEGEPLSLGLARGTVSVSRYLLRSSVCVCGLWWSSRGGGLHVACKACLFSRPQDKSMSGFGQRSALTLRITTQSVGPRALWGRDGGGGERFGNEMGYDIRLVACGFSGGVPASCRRPALQGWPRSTPLSPWTSLYPWGSCFSFDSSLFSQCRDGGKNKGFCDVT